MYNNHNRQACPGPCCAVTGANVSAPGTLEPQVEHLVVYAHHNGYLEATSYQLRTELSKAQDALKISEQAADEARRKLNYVKEDFEEVVKERDSALRKIPKKVKKATKKGKK